MIYGPLGRVSARFVAVMHGAWRGDQGTLREEFTYATGAQQLRQWAITMGENGQFTATAPDVIGAAQGVQRGAAIFMKYRLRLDADAGGHVLDVRDWIYLAPNGAMTNKSVMRKFGIKVAELNASIRPIAADAQAA